MNTQDATDADNRPSLKNLFTQTDKDGEFKLPSIDEVKAALEAGADVNEYVHGCEPATYLAVKHGNMELLRLLVEHKADMSGETGFKLMRRAFSGYLWSHKRQVYDDIIRFLFTHGIDPNIRDDSHHTLLMTPEANEVEITQLLIEYGADVNARTMSGSTALIHAARFYGYRQYKTRRKLFSLLLDAGADVNSCSYRGRSALMCATIDLDEEDLMDALQYLIERGADPTICDIYGFSLSDYARFYMASPKVQRYINQLLHEPAEDDILEQSSQSDEEINVDEDYDGGNLLHKFLSDRTWQGIFQLKVRDDYCAELIRRLCMTGLDVNERDNKGRTPLMYAADTWCSERFIPILLEYGADPTMRDANGFTALNYAQFDDASPEVQELLTPKD